MVLETIKNEFPISIGSCLFAIAIALSVPATALADANDKSQPEASANGDAIDDACYGLNQNEDWYRLFNLFSASFKAGDYDKALEYTSALEEICARSPILNYSIANTYAKIGDRERAKRYIVAATDNLNEFSTTYEMIAKIWSARCDIESSDIKNDTDDALKRENELNAQVESLKERTYEAIDAEKSHYAAIMWTGTAVGIVGIGSVVAGAVLIGTKDTDLRVKVNVDDIKGKNVDDIKGKEEKKLPIADSHEIKAGYALLGVGIAATVTGAIMAGLGGYHYKRIIDSNPDTAISFNVSPTSLALGVTF